MMRAISLNEFRKRFEVAHRDDLAADEPNKYFDPFIERDE